MVWPGASAPGPFAAGLPDLDALFFQLGDGLVERIGLEVGDWAVADVFRVCLGGMEVQPAAHLVMPQGGKGSWRDKICSEAEGLYVPGHGSIQIIHIHHHV